MAKDSGPSAVLLVTLAAIGLLTATYGGTREESRVPTSSREPASDEGKRAVTRSKAGRYANSPAEIPARGWWTVLQRVFAGFNDDRLMTEAAGVTFYTLLAIFPAMATLVSLYGFFADPVAVNDHLATLAGIVPGAGWTSSQPKSRRSPPTAAKRWASGS